jgi:hypothetical protein
MPSSTERTRQYRLRHRELGLCSQCSEPVASGKTRCARHLQLLNESHPPEWRREQYQRLKAAGITDTPEYLAHRAAIQRAYRQRQRARRAEQDADEA